MTPKSIPTLCLAGALALALSACGRDASETDTPPAGDAGNRAASAPAASAEAEAFAAPNLADGPDVCFKAIAAHLGADAKVSEITSFFASGAGIDASDTKPKGQMTTCTVKYQNPEDPRKLLSTSMDLRTGTFGAPQPLEIRVSGNASEFNLEDYVIPLSRVDAAALTGIMDAQKAALDGVFSQYAFDGVRLETPDAFSDVHTLRLDIEGRLASNDIQESGYASVSIDGKQITSNHLLPR